MTDSTPPTIKLLLIGPSNSGKTSLLLRYLDDTFDPDSTTATIGVDFRVKHIEVAQKPYKLLLFDTAGQERFRTLTSTYYRNAQGILVIYDISSRDSFLSMPSWFAELERFAPSPVVKMLVGTKADKTRAVTEQEGREMAERFGAGFMECSSRTREGVKEPFARVVGEVVKDPQLLGRMKRKPLAAPQEAPAAGCAC